MANINDFKANLAGGGARANQFQVTMTFPGYAAIGGETNKMAYLCTTAALPGMTIGEVPVAFRGRSLYIAGDRTFDVWTTTVLNDTDFLIRNVVERWMNGINTLSDNSGLENPADYLADGTVDQLDRAGNKIKTYTLRGCWPTTLSEIALGYDQNDAVEQFDITWRYQYFETNTTT